MEYRRQESGDRRKNTEDGIGKPGNQDAGNQQTRESGVIALTRGKMTECFY